MAAKRKAFDIETKYNALNDIQKGVKSRQAIASEYGVSVNTLNGWAMSYLRAYQTRLGIVALHTLLRLLMSLTKMTSLWQN